MPAPTHRLHIRRLDTVGFVDKGDDPKAEIVFFKRAPSEKRAETFSEVGSSERINEELWDLTHRLNRSLRSALEDADDDQDPAGIMNDSLTQFENTVRARIPMWLQGQTVEKDGVISRVLKALGLKEDEVDKLLAEGADASGDDGSAGGTDPDGDTNMPDPTFDVTKLDEAAQAEFAKLQADLDEAKKLAEAAPPAENEEVTKRLEAAEKRAEDAETAIQKLQDEREHAKYIAKAGTLGLTADDWAVPLRKIAGALTEEEFTLFETTQKALVAQLKESALYKEIGRGGSGAASETETQVQEAAAEFRKANPSWTAERARGEVMMKRPDLRDALEAERQSRVGHLTSED